MRQQYEAELQATQQRAEAAAKEAAELKAEVERRDSELGSLRAAAGALPSAAALVFKALEDEAVGATLAAAQKGVQQAMEQAMTGDLGAVVKAATEGAPPAKDAVRKGAKEDDGEEEKSARPGLNVAGAVLARGRYICLR